RSNSPSQRAGRGGVRPTRHRRASRGHGHTPQLCDHSRSGEPSPSLHLGPYAPATPTGSPATPFRRCWPPKRDTPVTAAVAISYGLLRLLPDDACVGSDGAIGTGRPGRSVTRIITGGASTMSLASISRFVLRHKLLVVLFW